MKIKADHIKFFVLIICLLFIGIDLFKTISTRMNYCELFLWHCNQYIIGLYNVERKEVKMNTWI